MQTITRWFNPGLHMGVTVAISLSAAIFSFRSVEFERETLVTFIAFYIILVAMMVMFIFRSKLTNPKTRQLMQFSYILLGFVLMITGIFGMFNGTLSMASVFLLMVFLPGLATLRAGLHFGKNGD
ncbi:hypothetical protein HQ531_04005 [bacterium]|nr:hypothetical protein [bacterium]